MQRTISKALISKSNQFSSHSGQGKLVLGCGSNVVDQIFKVQAVPNVGEKGFFQSPTKTLEASIIGGVTLNHLAWASLLGVPTSLLALQGNDNSGNLIRNKLKELGINSDHVVVKDSFSSAESYVFLQSDGERSIIMASGSTISIDGTAAENYFGKAIQETASMVTTEISQVPLSGVIQLLASAKKENILSAIDLDISPTVAFNQAKLGTMDELNRALCMADIIKPTLHAAEEYLQLRRPDLKRSLDPRDVVKYLLDLTDAQLVAITNGAKDSILATKTDLITVPVRKLAQVVDATGAGDAFFGGLIAGIHFNGFPSTEEDLWNLGELSNETGACNCLVLGALPTEESKTRLNYRIEAFKEKGAIGNVNIQELTHVQQLSRAEQTSPEDSKFIQSLKRDLKAIEELSLCINHKYVDTFTDMIHKCTGNVFTSGIGKSGIVANRFAASLSSIGIPSQYVHATEWAHGDLGKIREKDIIIFISHSGNTDEVLRAMELVQKKQVKVLAIIGTEDSAIGKACQGFVSYNSENVVEPLGGIPTTSIILQDAIINGLMCSLIEQRKFTREDFLSNHPGGSLGIKFSHN